MQGLAGEKSEQTALRVLAVTSAILWSPQQPAAKNSPQLEGLKWGALPVTAQPSWVRLNPSTGALWDGNCSWLLWPQVSSGLVQQE